jgi:hypothetical protein
MPGKPAALHVRGTCKCRTPGYSLELEPQEPQGINPRDFLLRLVETAPTGPQPEVITDTPVSFRRETDTSYDTVSIVPEGPVGIPVGDTSRG